MNKGLLASILESIYQQTGEQLSHPHHQTVSGGDICQSFLIYGTLYDNNNNNNNNNSIEKEHRYFVKTQSADFYDALSSEYRSLQILKQSQTLTTPNTIAFGQNSQHCFLILEYLALSNKGDESQLGQQLAAMHRHSHSLFGFEQDNFIGRSPQYNQQSKHWADFWREQRLRPQLALAYRNKHKSIKPFEQDLLRVSDELLAEHQPQPSLLHGDLWGGNKSFLEDGRPVIFDPASYYGDRETDIAMTYLFGGFSQDFYRAYHASWPLPPGANERRTLYNLYHQLNHLNLFGETYLPDCLGTIRNLIG